MTIPNFILSAPETRQVEIIPVKEASTIVINKACDSGLWSCFYTLTICLTVIICFLIAAGAFRKYFKRRFDTEKATETDSLNKSLEEKDVVIAKLNSEISNLKADKARLQTAIDELNFEAEAEAVRKFLEENKSTITQNGNTFEAKLIRGSNIITITAKP